MSMDVNEQGLPAGYPFKPEWELAPRDAKVRLERGDLLLLDVRLLDELKAASIEGATHIPLQELAIRIDELGEDDDQRIATLCHHGRRALRAAALLRDYGFAHTWSVAGGIDLWSLVVDPSVPRYTRVAGECRLLDR